MPSIARLSTTDRTFNHIPSENPVPLGYTISYSWVANTSTTNFITSIYKNNPFAFASNPFYTGGTGGPNSTLRFTLANGFRVSYYQNDGNGSENITTSITGATYDLWMGQTVSGITGSGVTLGGSGNGNSSIIITYVGA